MKRQVAGGLLFPVVDTHLQREPARFVTWLPKEIRRPQKPVFRSARYQTGGFPASIHTGTPDRFGAVTQTDTRTTIFRYRFPWSSASWSRRRAMFKVFVFRFQSE